MKVFIFKLCDNFCVLLPESCNVLYSALFLMYPIKHGSLCEVIPHICYCLHTFTCRQERCWVIPILQDTLRHVYQRSLLETQPEVLDLIERVWSALLQSVPAAYLVGTATPWLGVWLCLLMQPATISYDSGYLIEARHRVKVRLGLLFSHVLFELRCDFSGTWHIFMFY